MGIQINSDFALHIDPGHKDYQDIFEDSFMGEAPIYPIIFTVDGSDRPTETAIAYTDVGEPDARTPGSPPSKESNVKEMWSRNTLHVEYAMRAAIDRKTWRDMGDSVRGLYPKSYGEAMNSKAEAIAASVVSGGFADLGGDGKAIFATDHPLDGGGTFSNKGTSALSKAALIATRAAMRTQLSQNGRVMGTPKGVYLLVPAALEGTANEIVNATTYGVAGGAFNNASFSSEMGIKPVVWEHLDVASSLDWYVSAEPDSMDGFRFWWREAPDYMGGMNRETFVYWLNSTMECSADVRNVRQMYGHDV
jgi:hypothetical protein